MPKKLDRKYQGKYVTLIFYRGFEQKSMGSSSLQSGGAQTQVRVTHILGKLKVCIISVIHSISDQKNPFILFPPP